MFVVVVFVFVCLFFVIGLKSCLFSFVVFCCGCRDVLFGVAVVVVMVGIVCCK